MSKITLQEATNIADQLNIDLNKIPVDHFRKALQLELEHGTKDPATDITNDDLLMTGKIALAHINEFPDYYDRLEVLEEEADTYWEGRERPNIYRQIGVYGDANTKISGKVDAESLENPIAVECPTNNYRKWSVWLTFILLVLIYAYYRG